VAQPVPSDIEQIIQALKLQGAEVEGPTEHDEGLVYRINKHTLNEHEIRSLAQTGRLTSWEIFNYVRNRDFGR
jgi:hypothetical protein